MSGDQEEPVTLAYAIEITTKISNALDRPGMVGRCRVPSGRCSDYMNRWDVARDGCAPCRANTLAALLVDALQHVRKGQA